MAELEALSLGGYNLNDQVTWSAEGELQIAPPSKRLQRISSPDADADLLAEAATYELRQVTIRLRYVAAAGDMDDALTAINTLQGYLQQAEELDDGSALVWTPANSTFTGTMYVQTGEITGLPVTWSGDDTGWFLANPVITLRLDCFPFIEGAEYLAASMSSTSTRIGTLVADDVPGTIPAKGRLVITDGATQNRSHVEIGGERYGYDSGSPSSLDILGSSMSALAGTITGSGAGSYVSMSAGTTAAALAEVTAMPHTGPHNVRAQIERTAAGTTLRVRALARTADGPWSHTPWRTVPDSVGTFDVYLGTLDFAVVKKGTQTSTLRLECSASASTTIRLYRFNPIPIEVVYGVARAPTPVEIPAATSFTYVDNFNQSGGGNLSGKSPDTGSGTWSESGSATNFTYDSTNHRISRATIADAAPHFGTIGSAVGDSAVSALMSINTAPPQATTGMGVLLRYGGTNDYLAALVVGSSILFNFLVVREVVAGTPTELLSAGEVVLPASEIAGRNTRITFAVKSGIWMVALGTNNAEPTLRASGYRASLDSGGALATGKAGIYDMETTTSTRLYDSFYVWTPTANAALYSGRSAEFRHDAVIRESSSGGAWTAPPSYRGRRLYVPPAGPADLSTRLAIKDRRTDVDGGVPDSADSSRTASLYLTPRWLSVPG